MAINTIANEIEISVNGDLLRLADGTNVLGLLDRLELKTDRVAVERNRAIVSRSEWESTELHAGDVLEVVHFVGGG